MNSMSEQANAGQAAFTKTALALYDSMVLGITCHFIWRCPTERILRHYESNLSDNHLEVGVGTGYFLDKSHFPSTTPRLALLDLNPNCLEHTARRLVRYSPEVYQANVLAPIRMNITRFDSIALNYVLHCLPGELPDKGTVFANLKSLLRPGGVLFGSTLLHDGVEHGLLSRGFMRLYNARRLLNNRKDGLSGLRTVLNQHLNEIRIETAGSVALFSGRA